MGWGLLFVLEGDNEYYLSFMDTMGLVDTVAKTSSLFAHNLGISLQLCHDV